MDVSFVHRDLCYESLDFLETLACLEVAGGQMELAMSFCLKFRRSTIAVTVQTNMAPSEEAQDKGSQDQQCQASLLLEATELNGCLEQEERHKVHVLKGETEQAGPEVPVMMTIADAGAAEEAGKYCIAEAVDCEIDARSTVHLGMTAAAVNCMTDNRSSVGTVQGRKVVHVLAADSGRDCCCRTGSSVQCFEALANALSSIS
jgi:hypothetical protein